MTPEQQHEWSLEIFRSLAEAGKAALNTLVLVSGGSGAAILSFVAGLAGKAEYAPLVARLMLSLPWFAGSFVAAVLVAGLSYVAQGCYKRSTYLVDTDRTASDQAERWGDGLSRAVAFVYGLAFGSLTLGMFFAIRAGLAAT